MGQTSEGAKKAALTSKRLHGDDYHSRIGSKGGKLSKGGLANMSKEKAKEIQSKGGKNRWKNAKKD